MGGGNTRGEAYLAGFCGEKLAARPASDSTVARAADLLPPRSPTLRDQRRVTAWATPSRRNGSLRSSDPAEIAVIRAHGRSQREAIEGRYASVESEHGGEGVVEEAPKVEAADV
jgi:hypothetical protein